MKKELIAFKDPKSFVSELFRTLRTNIQFMNSNKQLTTLLVTSTLPGEGKSWVSSNLATTFAQAGKRVVLIDADMRKGRIYNIFGVLPRPGLSNYLSGVGENDGERSELVSFLRETEVPNLYVMPAGNIPPNPSELLITSKMVNLLEELKKECDLIIIDGTPSKLVTDAVILSRIVDSTIIVTGHNQTRKDDLEKIARDIKNVGGNIIGIVYNKTPALSKKTNETYYYASDSHRTQVNGNTADVMQQKSNNTKTGVGMSKDNRPKKEMKPNVMRKENSKQEQDIPKAFRKDTEQIKEKTGEWRREYDKHLKNEKKKKFNRR
ncbi:MAG: CpsD/CapB family tyrosine-protein kinase [Clostridia bacterium]|jgi:capsular exopolysaccharide synthesis family protein|nr:CpsD/CapB family tyrosine-protein kinase [Clostridia bacterium]